jgi:hypothetical protein
VQGIGCGGGKGSFALNALGFLPLFFRGTVVAILFGIGIGLGSSSYNRVGFGRGSVFPIVFLPLGFLSFATLL